MNKRGQGALEFLTTYGFSFMLTILMIGALAYFGVLNPDRFLPSRCSASAEFTCIDYQISIGDTEIPAIVKLINNVGTSIKIESVICNWDAEKGLIGDSTPVLDVSIGAGQQFFVECDFDQTKFPPAENKMKFEVVGKYVPIGRAREFSQSFVFEVYTTVQE